MWKLAPALALMLAGCWQVAVVGDQLTTGGNGSTGAKPTSGSSGTGGRSSGSSGGRSASGTSSGANRVCGNCAPGATCDGGVCVCPGATDGTTCSYETTEMQEMEGLFCIEGTCAACVTEGGSLQGDQCLIPLATGINSPSYIAVDGTSVYWTDAQGIRKAPIRDLRKSAAPAAFETLFAVSNPSGLAIDAYYVYFTVVDDGTVMEVPLDGGEAITLATNQSEPWGIAVDGEHIYWTNYSGNQVMRLMKTAAPVVPDVIAAAVDGGNPFGIWINDSSVFWTNKSNGEVLMASLDGGEPTILANGQTEPFGIVGDAARVYWTNNYGSGQVVKEPLAGPLNKFDWTISNQGGATGVAVDSEFVYWTNNSCSSNCVLRVPLDGGPVTSVFPGEGAPTKGAYGIAVDSENLYWTIDVNLSGVVYELTPK